MALTVRIDGCGRGAAAAFASRARCSGRISGSAAPWRSNVSTALAPRAARGAQSVECSLNICPGETFETLEPWLLEQERDRPKAHGGDRLWRRVLPAAVADGVDRAGGAAERRHTGAPAARRSPAARARAARDASRRPRQPRLQLCGGHRWRHPARGNRSGAHGIARLPGLFLVGEILDVDGRLGGFNFQWAWSSAWVAAQALARALSPAHPR